MNIINDFVSIIMPLYNCEKHIDSAIRSILKQTHQNFELIIIDDGSTDNSFNIIKSIKDERIIYKKKNHTGISESLNLGIELSKSNLIFRMDADDYSEKNRLEKQINFMNQNPQVSLSGTFLKIFDDNNKFLSFKKLPLSNKFIKETIIYNSNIMHPTFCFRKKDIVKVGCYRKEFVYAQDYDLLLRLITQNCILANIPEYLVSYRINKANNLNKIYNQMRYTRLAKKLYFERLNKKNESSKSKESIKQFKQLNKFDKLIFKLFLMANNKRISNNFPKNLWILLSYIISIFNYELFIALLNDFIYYFKIKYDQNR